VNLNMGLYIHMLKVNLNMGLYMISQSPCKAINTQTGTLLITLE
jgi:hypothetical protein